jgi:hypothetical protein
MISNQLNDVTWLSDGQLDIPLRMIRRAKQKMSDPSRLIVLGNTEADKGATE